jgi:UDP-N-acetyl-D-glucosamine dehydrogenase
LKILIVGQGYVGLPLTIAFAKSGCEVIAYDTNVEKVQSLSNGISYIEDVENSQLNELIQRQKIIPTQNLENLDDLDAVIIAVPTPLNAERDPDLSALKSAASSIGMHLKKRTLIVNESTSYPGTLREIIKTYVEANSTSKIEHLYASSPERVDPGNKNWNLQNTPRLFSGLTREASEKTKVLYSKIADDLIEVESPEIAELSKLFENTFRQVNIALVNEFYLTCLKLDIDCFKVLDAAESKPYGFMKFIPGIGVGGHCIPVDPTYLSFRAKESGATTDFIDLANKTNLSMPNKTISAIEDRWNLNIESLRILIVGLAYKANISDIRESPSLRLLDQLKQRGCDVYWHDNLVGTYDGEISSEISKNYDLIIVTVFHDYMNVEEIKRSSQRVFDLTGKLSR